jgi:hypothetical protein
MPKAIAHYAIVVKKIWEVKKRLRRSWREEKVGAFFYAAGEEQALIWKKSRHNNTGLIALFYLILWVDHPSCVG